MSTRLALAAVLLAAAAATGWWLYPGTARHGAPEVSGAYLATPRPLPEFRLELAGGVPFTRDSLRGHWTFLYFGYTHCPDVCPLALAELASARARLAEAGLADAASVVLVSVDPRRDTPEHLAQYAAYFDPGFAGATGAPAELERLAAGLGVYFQVPENPPDPDSYPVDHSAAILLVNPRAELAAVLTAPHGAERLAADFRAVRAAYRAGP